MLALLAAASFALAADPAAQPSTPVTTLTPEQAAAAVAAANEPQPEWYGWQTLLLDGFSAGCFFGASSVGSDGNSAGNVLMLFGVGLYAFGGPSVHFQHGDSPMGLIDIGMRVAIPVGVTLAGMALGVYKSVFDVWSYGVIGAGLGMAIAAATDAFGLAYDPVPRAPPAHASIQWTPFLGAARGSPLAGVAGAF